LIILFLESAPSTILKLSRFHHFHLPYRQEGIQGFFDFLIKTPMMKKRFCLAVLFLFSLVHLSQAQKFGIAGIIGANLCQINGDNQKVYKKQGWPQD
jgi:hypothetical protein